MGSTSRPARTPKTEQCALTTITEIQPGQVVALSDLLKKIGENLPDNSYISFSKVPRLHFVSWTILAEDPSYPPLLAFEANYDGSLDSLLDELITNGRLAFDQIYAF